MHKSRHFRVLERFNLKQEKKSLKKKKAFRNKHISRNTWKYFWWEMRKHLCNFCTLTSMHGFRNMTSNRLSLRENQVWAAICFLALSLLIFALALNWDGAMNPSISIDVDNTENIKELNFPAVTVCNHNQVYKPFADELSGNLTSAGYTSHQIKQFFQTLPILIRPFEFREVDLETFNKMFQHLNIPVKKLMRQLMQPCEKMIPYCAWIGKDYNCSSLFKVVESYLGFCCGFNYHIRPFILNRHNETYNKINPDDNDIQCKNDTDCPGMNRVLKVPGSGIDAALHFYINLEPKQYLGLTKPYSGASIILHESHNYPQLGIHEKSIQIGKMKSIVLSGTETKSEEAIRKIPMNIRQCVFRNELSSENDFSYMSCIAICKLKRFKQICGCIPYYYPVSWNNSTKPCDFSNVKCIKRNIDSLRKVNQQTILGDGRVLRKCKCLKMCNKIQYVIYSERAFMTYGLRNPYFSDYTKRSSYNISVARVYFQDYTFFQNKRRLTFSWIQSIGSLGGLFGLCLGGSFISILEPIVYFLIGYIRKTYDQKVQAKEVKTKNEDKGNVNDNRKKLSPISKIHKRLPLRERLKKWDNLPPRNDISMLESDFKMYVNFKKSKLILPRGNNTVS